MVTHSIFCVILKKNKRNFLLDKSIRKQIVGEKAVKKNIRIISKSQRIPTKKNPLCRNASDMICFVHRL